jgi:hypothetical protein
VNPRNKVSEWPSSCSFNLLKNILITLFFLSRNSHSYNLDVKNVVIIIISSTKRTVLNTQLQKL